jgi:hypothetical protein
VADVADVAEVDIVVGTPTLSGTSGGISALNLGNAIPSSTPVPASNSGGSGRSITGVGRSITLFTGGAEVDVVLVLMLCRGLSGDEGDGKVGVGDMMLLVVVVGDVVNAAIPCPDPDPILVLDPGAPSNPGDPPALAL